MPRRTSIKKKAPPQRQTDEPEERRQEQRNEDAALIKRALSGDQRAYQRLRQKYEAVVHHIIKKMVHNREELEDLTQETFIKAFQSLASFKAEYAFSTWLYRIATNNCIDYIRRKKLQTLSIDRQIESEESDYSIELPDTSYTPDRQLIEAQKRKLIEQAIASLPPKYREVIRLRHMEEKDYQEIADELGIPLGTVKAHIFRARELLYKYMKNKVRHY